MITKAQHDVDYRLIEREIIELIETITVYKFPRKSCQELQAMLGLSAPRETKFYQEAAQETKLEIVPRLLQAGLSLEKIAEVLELPLDEIKKAAQQE